LFATWFTYDSDGKGMWLVMPRAEKIGQRQYAGPMYRTTGPEFDAYDPSRVVISEVGRGTFSFSDANSGSFSYRVNGVNGQKPIGRYQFAVPATVCQ
jgi:hypothetical protein